MTRNASTATRTAPDRLRTAIAGARERVRFAYDRAVHTHDVPYLDATQNGTLEHHATLLALLAAAGVGLTGLFHVLAVLFGVLATVLQHLGPALGVLGDLASYAVVALLLTAGGLWIAAVATDATPDAEE